MTLVLAGLALFLLALSVLGLIEVLWDPYGEHADARSRNRRSPQ